MSSKILLIEDDLFMRQLYTDLLKEQKYELDTAEDGDQGYEKIKKGGWDLVLLDMNLPGMSGIEIIEKLSKEGVKNLYKKIVFLTNTDNAKDSANIKKNSDGYLLKSQLTPEEFLEQVKKFL